MRILCVGLEVPLLDVISKWSMSENVVLNILVAGNKTKLSSLINKYPDISFNHFPNKEPKIYDEVETFEINGFTVNRIIKSDRVLRNRNHEESVVYCKNVISLVVEEINKFKPTIIFSTYDNAHSSLSYLVAESFGIKWASFCFTTIPEGFCTIATNPFEIDKIFDTNNKNDWNFNESINLINNTENKTQNVFKYVPSNKFLSYIKNINARITGDKGYNKYQWTTIAERIHELILKSVNKLFLRVFLFFQKKINNKLNEKYVLYMVQMSPESTVDVWATEYISQIQVIEDISINLPANFKLFVKIHPSDPGSLGVSDFRKIKSLGNVHIISYKFGSKNYLKNAELVATITGTAALEAFLYSVPSIMFGKHFYSRLPGVNYFNNNRVELGLFLKNIIENKIDLTVKEKAIEFTNLMSNFNKCRFNNWKIETTPSESKSLFKLLEKYEKSR